MINQCFFCNFVEKERWVAEG